VFVRRLTKVLVYLAIMAALVIGVLRATVIRWWRVPDDDPYLEASLAPTLAGGDLIILSRLSPPRFGDLALCPEPKADGRVVIGRLLGTPGDKVEVLGTHVRVNGRNMHDESGCKEPTFTVIDPASQKEVEQGCDHEDLSGRIHLRGNIPAGRAVSPITLTAEKDQGILVSDNRLFPYDSRDFGAVSLPSCKETVVFRLVSAKGFGDVATRLSLIW
jgi:signal peptidase I